MIRSDIAPLAALLRSTADLLERKGAQAWDQTKQWQPGLRAASLQGGSGSGQPADPTGTAACTPQPDPHIQLVVRLRQARAVAIDLTALVQAVEPPKPGRWCHWMAEVDVREPAPRTIDGKPASRWIYDRWNATGRIPSLDSRLRRAQGRNVPRTADRTPTA